MSADERHLIQIEADEDPTSVKDRLGFYRGGRVLLIWPEKGTALTRKLDIVLIQREAMRRQIKLAFVTHDPQVIQHAADLNISTYQTIGASERGRWKRGRTRVFTGRERRPSLAPTADELEEVASRSRARRRPLSLRGLLIRVLIVGAFLGVTFALFYFTVPGAVVRLVPARQVITASVQITVNGDETFNDVDIENAILPAMRIRVEIEESAEIPTTGTQSLGDVRAIGEVVFINQTNQVVEIPEGTTISTSAGTPIIFRTTSGGTLTAGEGNEITLPVEATQSSAGDVGNVDANLINTVIGPLESQVTVINPQPTREGSSRVEAAVASADIASLESQVDQLLQARAYQQMLIQPQIGDNQHIIVETLRIVEERPEWTRFSAGAGDLAETLRLTKRAIVEALVVDTTLGQQIVFARMAQQIPRGRVFDTESISYQTGDVSFAGDLILFTMSGAGTVVGQINERQIREDITNMPIDEAINYLMTAADIQEATSPEITVSPDIFGRLPLWTERIQVEVVTP